MPKYFPSGDGRESYILNIRPGAPFAEFHDVTKRRDNLPLNVFEYLKEGVFLEEQKKTDDKHRRIAARVEYLSGPKGKKMSGGAAGDAIRQVKEMEEVDRTQFRHRQLRKLYSAEREDLEKELAERGLATFTYVQ